MKAAALGVRLLLVFGSISCSESGGPAPATMGNPCVPGQQVACACLGGAMGVQICNDEGSGLKSCDCGMPLSDASDDRVVVGGVGGSILTNDATSISDQTSDVSTIVDGDGAGDSEGSNTSPDDPCPIAETVINCSSTCANQQACMPITTPTTPCGSSDVNTSVVEVDSRASPKPVLRTPSHPGIFTCSASCPKYPAFALRIVDKNRYDFSASVSPPWQLMVFNNIPCGFVGGTTCLSSAGGGLTLYTYDPDAPSRNVTFGAWQGPCPRGDAQ